MLGWDRMPYGPPLHTLVVDSVEIVAMVRRDHPEACRSEMPRHVFGRHPFVMFPREPSADVFDWMIHAATGRQPEQVVIEQVDSLDDGTGSMLRAALRGSGLTVAAGENPAIPTFPELVAMPFTPPIRHDVLLYWPAGRESSVTSAFAAHCTPG